MRGAANQRYGPLVRHYFEMVAAMVVGMVVMGLVHDLVWPSLTERADIGALVMATDMALGMSAWMRFRGHPWLGIAEMSASMYVPFVVLLVPFWTGFIDGGDLMIWGHIAMFAAMALVVFARPAQFAH